MVTNGVANHKTAKIVLELMTISPVPAETSRASVRRERSKASSSPRRHYEDSDTNEEPIAVLLRTRAQHLQDALSAAASHLVACSSTSSDERLSTGVSSVYASSSTTTEDFGAEPEPPCWEAPCIEKSKDEDSGVHRGRARAAAQVNSDEDEEMVFADMCSDGRWIMKTRERQVSSQSDDSCRSSLNGAVDEMDHPDLTGALAALHGYEASGGETVLLETAYDLARGVAGRRHDMNVAFDAFRIALAAGYVHSLKQAAPELARKFALQHSLPRLAQSLKVYWSREGQWRTLAEELEWEQCMLSLLEVTSSVFLMTEAADAVSVLDTEVGPGVAEAIGSYCVLNPDILSEYPHVGQACVRRYQAAQHPTKLAGHRKVRGSVDVTLSE